MGSFFGNIGDKLREFMVGRNGPDKLATATICVALVISIITLFAPNPILVVLNYAALIYFLFRILSRNVAARQAENAKFESLIGSFGTKKGKRGASGGATSTGSKSSSSSKAYTKNSSGGGKTTSDKGASAKVRFTCDSCGQPLSVPAGRGKLKVTCPKCHHQQTIDS